MAKSNHLTLFQQEMTVDYGTLLEHQIMKWKGGGTHTRGIAEYISNSDDSYIRQGFSDKKINVEIISKTGRKISKLIVSDNAEGMSKDDLESKFFQYYKSFSGRETANVSGRFGTGGKAYAIMNFQKCWIISVKDGFEHKAWFSWNNKDKKPIYGFDHGGYYYKKVDKPNGTTIELINSIKNNIPLESLMIQLCTTPRIRGTVKNQNVHLKIDRKGDVFTDKLDYEGVNLGNSTKNWSFPIPNDLKNISSSNELILYYFKEPLERSQSIIEVSDGKTLFIDLNTSDYDNRPFSKYIYGEIIIEKLYDSHAVKENLEENLIRGNWIEEEIELNENDGKQTLKEQLSIGPRFEPNENGNDFAVKIDKKSSENVSSDSSKKGISVLMTDDPNSPDSADLYSEFEDPVLDKYLKSDGIVLVNVNNPIIEKYRSKKQFQSRFNENIANYVLLIVAQYQTQKELELQSPDEREDSLINFRRKFFDLQRALREDDEINFFEFDEE